MPGLVSDPEDNLSQKCYIYTKTWPIVWGGFSLKYCFGEKALLTFCSGVCVINELDFTSFNYL